MTNPMTLDERYAILRNALEMIGLILDDPTPERIHRCQVLAASALAETIVPVVKERTLIPHINESDPLSPAMKQFVEIFKS